MTPSASPAPTTAPNGPGRAGADVAIVGGGPAGLSAALYLARYDRTVLLVDAGHGRSSHHQLNRNYLGFPDGVPATELRRLGRLQLAAYPSVDIVEGVVSALQHGPDGSFALSVGDRSWRARALVLATGVSDSYPHFAEWESYVGRSMYWCITCDGYESRGRDVVVLGDTDTQAAEALQLRALTDRVRLVTNAPEARFGALARQRLADAGIPVIEDRVVDAEGSNGVLRALRLEGGDRLTLEALFCPGVAAPKSALAQALQLRTTDAGYIDIDSEQTTSVPGVFAAGDVTALHSHQVSAAVHEGAQAASAVNYYLTPARYRLS